MKNPRSLQILKSCSTAAALALGLCGSAAFAQVSFTEWTATTGTPGWGTAANWSPGVVPSAPGAIVNINSNIGAAGLVITIPTGTTEVVGVLSLGDLSGNEGAFTINAAGAGATLEMNGNGGWAFINRITGASSAANVINVPITLSSLLNVNINTANNNAGLTINGIISGSKGLLLSGGGRLTMTGANTYTGNTQIANRGFGDSANPNLILSNVSANVADNAIAGHLLIGNASRGGTGSAVVHLGASEQIADDKYIRMDGTSGNNGFFKMLGHEETVRGIIDHTREGVIEVTQDEGTPTGTVGGIGAQANSTLTLNTQAGDVFYYGGYLRNRSGGSSTAVLNLIVKGAGTQILAGDRISYTGVTQVDGATLVLFDVRDGSSNNRFSSDVTLSNNATLEFRVNNTWNGFNRIVSGTGNIIRTGDTTATLNYTSSVTVAGDLTIAGHAGATNFSGAVTSFEDFRMLRPLLNMADNSIVRFQGASATFSGSFMVEGPLSQVIVQGALSVAGDVTLKRSYMSIQPGASGTLTANKISLYGRPGVNEGYLEIRNTGSANLTDRVNAAPIDSYGGTISFAHDGSANAFSEGLGTLNLIRGSSQIITTKATGGTSALSFAGITRTAGSGATIDFTGTDLGADLQNRILIGGAVPSDDGIIGGWATVNGNEFAVYGANGVQALNNAGTNQDVWTATTVNAKMIASQSATVVKTINSLNIQQTSGALTLTLGAVAGADLIIESGGLLSSGNNHVIAGTNSASITAGNAVGTANDEFFINVLNNTLRIDASIVERSAGSTLSLVKSGAGTLQLNNANTYRGPTRLNNGILSISNQNQLGANTADIIFNGGTLLANAGTVTINDAGRDITVTEAGGTLRVNQNATLTITRPINAVGAVVFDTTSGGTGPNTLNLNGNNTFAGGLETINAITTAVMNVTGSNTMSHIRVIGGSVNLGTNGVSTNTIAGDIRVEVGDLTLFGTNNFSGKVVLNGGRLILGGANSLTHTSGSFALQATGGFSLNGNTVTVNELTGGSTTNGKIDNGSASAAKIIINQESNTTYAGDIMDTAFSQGTAGKLSLTKTGNGNLTLTGNGSDYSGVTEILGGTITVNKLGLGGYSETSSIGSGYLATDLILNGGALRFNGTNQSVTDRSFTLGVGDEAGFLIADGTSRNAILTFGDSTYSDAVKFTGSGARTLTLGGFNVGDNTFNLVLGDGTGGRTSLNKTGNGTWILTRANTYTGKTVVTGGVLGVTANGALGAAAGDAVVLMGGQSVSGFPVGGVLDLRNVNYSDAKTIVLEGG
ncbi:autotransporter-associated beta strand repeat-containing protein [Verrucomicrobium sp. BvORR106]|uniref:beta strand repeat-containing protein n=1 Tax=Verrucomicrobium sp. BvORR106 TaxID=1403819 RepID=UPI0009DE6E84|nr:autotransporter-associated beta strand repeat-containing protein [Verrucomicrobium sp. BvORR106]